jgi:hypothetical protein
MDCSLGGVCVQLVQRPDILTKDFLAGFEVLTETVTRRAIFWYITLSWLNFKGLSGFK